MKRLIVGCVVSVVGCLAVGAQNAPKWEKFYQDQALLIDALTIPSKRWDPIRANTHAARLYELGCSRPLKAAAVRRAQ